MTIRSATSRAKSGASAASQAGARVEWPDPMKRDLQACQTPADYRIWLEKWASILGGLVREPRSEQPVRSVLPAAQRLRERNWS